MREGLIPKRCSSVGKTPSCKWDCLSVKLRSLGTANHHTALKRGMAPPSWGAPCCSCALMAGGLAAEGRQLHGWSGAGLHSRVLGVPVTQLSVSLMLSHADISPSPLGPLGFIKPVQLCLQAPGPGWWEQPGGLPCCPLSCSCTSFL